MYPRTSTRAKPRSHGRTVARWAALAMAGAAVTYAGLMTAAYLRYGHPQSPAPEESDALLDRFMPRYEVAERHHIRIAAPASVVLAAARDMDLMQGTVIRTIFSTRALVLRAKPDDHAQGRGLITDMEAIGWRVLAEVPDRELVVGAVTRPWEANVIFRSIPADAFATFAEPGYVKILWTLRADPDGTGGTIFRTETRVATTDADARTRFRRYWSVFSPGIVTIRWLLLTPLKADAERRAGR